MDIQIINFIWPDARCQAMVKFKKLWLFERSEFQRFLNFIVAQFIAEIKTRPLNYLCDGIDITSSLMPESI